MGFSAAGLVQVYNSLNSGLVGAEVGVCRGENIKALLDSCPNIKKIYGLDPWSAYADKLTISQEKAEGWYAEAQKLLADYIQAGRVELMRTPSLVGVNSFQDGFFDFVFIDGDHDYSAVKRDLVAWWPKVKTSGIFSGHDFRLKDRDVRKAVYQFATKNHLQVTETPQTPLTTPCWYIKGKP